MMLIGQISVEGAKALYPGAIEALERKKKAFFVPDQAVHLAIDLGANMLMFKNEPEKTLFWDSNEKSWTVERPKWAQPN